jgi:hypothetical protein
MRFRSSAESKDHIRWLEQDSGSKTIGNMAPSSFAAPVWQVDPPDVLPGFANRSSSLPNQSGPSNPESDASGSSFLTKIHCSAALVSYSGDLYREMASRTDPSTRWSHSTYRPISATFWRVAPSGIRSDRCLSPPLCHGAYGGNPGDLVRSGISRPGRSAQGAHRASPITRVLLNPLLSPLEIDGAVSILFILSLF